MPQILDWLLHFDRHLDVLVKQYGGWTYALLFLIVFCETGLVILPFLPGDSLLFAAGVLAARGDLDVWLLSGILLVAAVAGDTINYHIGLALGPRVLSGKLTRWLNPRHLEMTRDYFERYGAKTIILARFVPIVRTFAPFVAGVGKMNYGKFLAYNFGGGVIWVVSMIGAGYLLGGQPFVKDHFELVVLAIIAISLLPGLIEYLRHQNQKRTPVPTEKAAGEIPYPKS